MANTKQRYDIEAIVSGLKGISWKSDFQVPFTSDAFFKICKRANLPATNIWLTAYHTVGILTKIGCSKNTMYSFNIINSERVEKARNYQLQYRNQYKEPKVVEVHKTDNVSTVTLTEEECINFLKSKGYFVIKTSKGMTVTIEQKTEVFKF